MAMHSIVTAPSSERDNRGPPDFLRRFWSLAIPACLLFWVALAYAISSAM
jgi:hypothetical protein